MQSVELKGGKNHLQYGIYGKKKCDDAAGFIAETALYENFKVWHGVQYHACVGIFGHVCRKKYTMKRPVVWNCMMEMLFLLKIE